MCSMTSPFSRPVGLLIALLAITVTGRSQLGVDLVGKIEKTTSTSQLAREMMSAVESGPIDLRRASAAML